MPIPFIFPGAGFLLTGGGLTMVAKYVRADATQRGKFDAWLTEAIKATVKAYIRVRYGINWAPLQPLRKRSIGTSSAFGFKLSWPSRNRFLSRCMEGLSSS